MHSVALARRIDFRTKKRGQKSKVSEDHCLKQARPLRLVKEGPDEWERRIGAQQHGGRFLSIFVSDQLRAVM